MTPIKHLIFSGGGPNVFVMFGALSYLKQNGYINIDAVTSVDGTSSGALLGLTYILNCDDTVIEDYFIGRPWEKVFEISPDIMFQSFQNRGLFDVGVIEQIMEPIMKSVGIGIDITMSQLYIKTNIEFTVYVSELNNFKLLSLSHINAPDERVIDVIYKSCAIPPLFKPVIDGDNCYLDGGIFANYPLNCFLNRIKGRSSDPKLDLDLNTIFGIKLIFEDTHQYVISETSSIAEYCFCVIKKLIMQRALTGEPNDVTIPNELLVYSNISDFDTIKQSIVSADERIHLMNEGKRYASVFYHYKMKQLDDDSQEPLNV